jgi:hypothetical protein
MAILLLKRLHITTRRMKPLQSFRIPQWLGFLALLGLFAGSMVWPNNGYRSDAL